MNKVFFPVIIFLAATLGHSGNDSLTTATDYRFIIMDSPARLFTMKQFNLNYLSAYRLLSRGMYSTVKNDRLIDAIQALTHLFFFIPLTHEEGHRSILTANSIGSVSQPYFNSKGAAYVKGVSDRTLRDLRDNNLPTYIRLHTAGLESDYMLTRRAETIGVFGCDYPLNYRWEYWLRKLAVIQYYLTGLFKYDVGIKEEASELDRDIVGYDTYGAARHLFRPEMEFYRYTRYDDLTAEERRFIKRTAWRSLLNLANPLIIGRDSFTIGKKLKVNGGFGYTMSPFGDFIDENVWLSYRPFNICIYVREFQSREKWFFGCGLGLQDYRPIEWLSVSAACHMWRQPKGLDFNTSNAFTGEAVETDIGCFLLNRSKKPARGFSLDLGLIYKSKGFLPEEVCMDEHFGFRIGTTLRK